MFELYRVALVTLGLALVSSPSNAQETQQPSSHGSLAEQDRQEDGHTAIDLFGINSALGKVETAIRDLAPTEDSTAKDRQNQREIEDLNAQKDMAWWAMWMFFGTAASVALSFAALVAILRTLHHTRRAADYAEDMAGEARNATIAANQTFEQARRANEIAHDNMLAQNRPWITLDTKRAGPVETKDDHVTLNLHLVVKNVSKFPARMVVVNTQAYWTQSSHQWPDIGDVNRLVEATKSSSSVEQNSSVMLPDGDLEYGFITMNAVQHPVMNKGGTRGTIDRARPINIVVVCCVVYKSTISDKWHHTAHLVYVRRSVPEGADPREQQPIFLNAGKIPPENVAVSIAKFSAANSIS